MSGLTKIFILSILCCSMLLSARQDDKKNQRELEEIREEMSSLQRQLSVSDTELRSELNQLENLDQQTTLQKKALRVLEKQINGKNRQLRGINKSIDSLNLSLDALKKIFKRQVIFMWKQERGSQFEWMLGSENFNQALVRYRYFQSVSNGLQRLYKRLSKTEKRLSKLQSRHSSELTKQRTLAKEKRTEQSALVAKRDARQNVVDKISRDRSLLTAALAEKRRSFAKLQNLIGGLTDLREGSGGQLPVQIDWDRVTGNFAGQRGKLNWPVRGRMVGKFGKYKNPELKTTLVNNGIDIAATKGSTVKCVFPGVASLITYMSGFGNTLIIDHNNDYYTVYAHLGEVLVQKYQAVKAGDIIGTVGESGSLDGARLHFEIYAKNKPVDPTKWLRRR